MRVIKAQPISRLKPNAIKRENENKSGKNHDKLD